MPAETHTHHEPVSEATVLDLLAGILDVDASDPGALTLAALGIDDELGLLALWEAVASELAERTLGELDVEELEVTTLGEVAVVFCEALGS